MRQSVLPEFFVTTKVFHGPPYSVVKRLGLKVESFAGLADLPNELLFSIVSDHLRWDEDAPRAISQLSAVSTRFYSFFGPLASQNLVAIGSKRTYEVRCAISSKNIDTSNIRLLKVRVRLVNRVTEAIGENEVAPILRKLAGLTSVSLTNVDVCRPIVEALSSLPNLVRLEYDACFYAMRGEDDEPVLHAPRHLRRLSVRFESVAQYRHLETLLSIIKASSQEIRHISVDFNFWYVGGMNELLDLELPRLVTANFYNADIDLSHSKQIKCLTSSQLGDFNISSFRTLTRSDGTYDEIPGFTVAALPDIDLGGFGLPAVESIHYKYTIGLNRQFLMTVLCLTEPEWEVLHIFFRLHPQLRVVNAWNLSIRELDDVGTQIRLLLGHCGSNMQLVEEIRFSFVWSFVPYLCEEDDDDDENASSCSCDGCINYPDMEYDQKRQLLEELVGVEVESHIDTLISSLAHVTLIEWWLYDGTDQTSPTAYWEWKIARPDGGEPQVKRQLHGWHTKSSLLPVTPWEKLRGMSMQEDNCFY